MESSRNDEELSEADKEIPNFPPPPYYEQSAFSSSMRVEDKLELLASKYQIDKSFLPKLMNLLKKFKILFVFDDTENMNMQINDSTYNSVKPTRWDELKAYSQISIDLANVFNPYNCTDVHFFLRTTARKVLSPEEIATYTRELPQGSLETSLKDLLDKVVEENSSWLSSDRANTLLIILITCTEPKNDMGKRSPGIIKKWLKSRPRNVFTRMVVFKDTKQSFDFLYRWDFLSISRFHVVNEYSKESNLMLRLHGQLSRFTFGDYVASTLIYDSFKESYMPLRNMVSGFGYRMESRQRVLDNYRDTANESKFCTIL